MYTLLSDAGHETSVWLGKADEVRPGDEVGVKLTRVKLILDREVVVDDSVGKGAGRLVMLRTGEGDIAVGRAVLSRVVISSSPSMSAASST